MKVSISELKNEMLCKIKFCYRLDETALKIVKLMKKANRDKGFEEFAILNVMVISKKDIFV